MLSESMMYMYAQLLLSTHDVDLGLRLCWVIHAQSQLAYCIHTAKLGEENGQVQSSVTMMQSCTMKELLRLV